jgi:hypothetical protein
MQVKRSLCLSVLGVVLIAAPAFTVDLDTLPEAVVSRISALGGKYEISDRINPYYLRGDFDGDGRVDYAVLLTERESGKRGMVVLLSSQAKPRILGAGAPIQYGAAKFDDLNFDSWRVYGKGTIDAGTGFEAPPGKVELILVQKKESASGFFRWSGTRFTWVQQGD